MENKKGKLFVVSGPSGAGKTCVVTEALKRLKNEYDISSYSIYKAVSAIAPFVKPFFWLTNVGAAGGDIWLDDVIYTQEEP